MSKKIKFDLICDDYSIHTIEDLQEHFSIREILDYFRNGLLLRWLEVRGYQEEYEAVKAIQETDDTKILKKLVSIFQIDATDEEITEAMELFHYRENRENDLKNYQMDDHAEEGIVRHAVTEYQKQIKELENFNGEEDELREKIKAFGNEFDSLISLDYDRLFRELASRNNWGVLLHFLTVPGIRKYYQNPSGQTQSAYFNLLEDKFLVPPKFSILDNIPGIHKENTKYIQQMTQIVPLQQRVMIIYLNDGSVEITQNATKKILHWSDCLGQFYISDGFSLRSSGTGTIYWMEADL